MRMNPLPLMLVITLSGCVRGPGPPLTPVENDISIIFPDFPERDVVDVGAPGQPYELDGEMLRAVMIAANDFLPPGAKTHHAATSRRLSATASFGRATSSSSTSTKITCIAVAHTRHWIPVRNTPSAWMAVSCGASVMGSRRKSSTLSRRTEVTRRREPSQGSLLRWTASGMTRRAPGRQSFKMEVPLLHPAYRPPLRLRVRTAGDRRRMVWLAVPLNDAEALSPVSGSALPETRGSPRCSQ